MNNTVYFASLGVVLAPLFGSIITGLFGNKIGPKGAHYVTIFGVGASFLLSLILLTFLIISGSSFNFNLYTWAETGGMNIPIGFMLDNLTTIMMVVVTFVSLCVHIYTIGYMQEDPGYQRFFSYISLFTFAMLMLVMANNFLQLFFGWEAVGVISYLLIGFWFKKESAIFANMKAFLVNRVGDFGFLIGIAAIYLSFGSLNYADVFTQLPKFLNESPNINLGFLGQVSAINFICIGLFIGAMGKSAQMPLHVWLPDSMEGPTPISALIHAATMVTAGVFMVARMSPLFEHAELARNIVLIIGACTALFMGILGIVMTDIKRVIAYSTLSQLGYMVAALGASAYSASIFHLVTHAFFKALLFLAAGSVIIGMHHEQDMQKMGNIRRYMPITYITCLLGSLALVGIPPFSGFFSKDLIIELIGMSQLPGSQFAYFAVVISVFITAFYSFRLFFWVFHGKERMSDTEKAHLHESPFVVWLPLVLLAIPSVLLGWITVNPIIFAEHSFFENAIYITASNNNLANIHVGDGNAMLLHALFSLPFWLALAGIFTAWICYVYKPELPSKISVKFNYIYRLLLNKYGFDEFNQRFFAKGSLKLGNFLWQQGDIQLIDGKMVNGTAKLIATYGKIIRKIQSGYLLHYTLATLAGLLVLLTWALL